MLRRLTYANVMSTLAVVIALGGSSYAAIVLPRDSVASKHVRNGALRSADLNVAARGLRVVATRTQDQSGHGDCFQGCAGVREMAGVAYCKRDEYLVGGGVDAERAGFENAVVVASRPGETSGPKDPERWYGKIRFEITTDSASIFQAPVYALCASK